MKRYKFRRARRCDVKRCGSSNRRCTDEFMPAEARLSRWATFLRWSKSIRPGATPSKSAGYPAPSPDIASPIRCVIDPQDIYLA